MIFNTATILALLPALASAWQATAYDSMTLVWQDTFAGKGGSSPNGNEWHFIENLHVNNELQRYASTSTRNVQLSGGGTLQIVPWNDNGEITSGRVESRKSFTPQEGKLFRVEANLRFGSPTTNGNKQGIWPAFWMLGDSIRNSEQVGWPACGEIDILENINGQDVVYGTTHCDTNPGGVCKEGGGLSSKVSNAGQEYWHVWRVEIDRRKSSWRDETITWFRDGQQFHQISGSTGSMSESVWKTLTAKPLFIILNVAVGGDWPGAPNSKTVYGYESMMEVAYVAVYSS